MATTIVPCIHNSYGMYPVTTMSSHSLTNNVIEVFITHREFHPDDEKEECEPLVSNPINPFCKHCEEDLINHLVLDNPIRYFSADQVVQLLRDMVQQKHEELEQTSGGYGQVKIGLNFYFDRPKIEEEVLYEDWAGVNCSNGLAGDFGLDSETLVKVTLDGGWALYFNPID